jgi:hypothetical protein
MIYGIFEIGTSYAFACNSSMRRWLDDKDFNAELEKGINDLSNGNVISAKIVAEKIKRDYGV